MRVCAISSCLAILFLCIGCTDPRSAGRTGRFAYNDTQFLLDGKPFQIRAGELHYNRIPRPYWRDRIQKAKAMGLNTLTVTAYWNVHEKTPGSFDFGGQNDIAEFVREIQQAGLYVMLRPGPYSCGEWDLGGYPWWLLKDHGVVLRSTEPGYAAYVARWLRKLGEELAPLQLDRGGPILTVQLENEYGGFGKDTGYLGQLRQMLFDGGFTAAPLVAVNPFWNIHGPTLPGVLDMTNFGAGDVEPGFEKLAALKQRGPPMAGEYWAGWFDVWGEPHHTQALDKVMRDLRWMLERGYSFNLYMVHGGTTFGWAGGARMEDGNYMPDVNSYDYDAPLNERGVLTPKFWAIRDLLSHATGETFPAPPAPTAAMTVPAFALDGGAASLWSSLPSPVYAARPLTMEDFDQAAGYILYRKTLRAPLTGDLTMDDVHDYAKIYLDGTLVGTLDRRSKQNRLHLDYQAAGDVRLDILVEDMGRTNYAETMLADRKGITKSIAWNGAELTGWEIYPLDMQHLDRLKFTAAPCRGPCFYRADMRVSDVADTFLDTSDLGKGEVWVNGHLLGRYWTAEGPQQTLFVPAPWLKQGANRVHVFDVDGHPDERMRGWTGPRFKDRAKPQ